MTRDLPGKYVDSYECADGRLEFRCKGVPLPFRVFYKDRRVPHAAITESKRLSAVLEQIKAEQDKTPPKTHRDGKRRTKYENTGHTSPGRPSLMQPDYQRKRAERQARAADQGSDT